MVIPLVDPLRNWTARIPSEEMEMAATAHLT
jgi:hypothetical protein